jgi:hypothetical protein
MGQRVGFRPSNRLMNQAKARPDRLFKRSIVTKAKNIATAECPRRQGMQWTGYHHANRRLA